MAIRVSERHLVLLPGFMCDADLWAGMAGDLARLGRVHYGNVYQDDTLEGMARRVLTESPDKFVLVGFSMAASWPACSRSWRLSASPEWPSSPPRRALFTGRDRAAQTGLATR